MKRISKHGKEFDGAVAETYREFDLRDDASEDRVGIGNPRLLWLSYDGV